MYVTARLGYVGWALSANLQKPQRKSNDRKVANHSLFTRMIEKQDVMGFDSDRTYAAIGGRDSEIAPTVGYILYAVGSCVF